MALNRNQSGYWNLNQTVASSMKRVWIAGQRSVWLGIVENDGTNHLRPKESEDNQLV
jgi:hypothetical protein